MYIQFDKNYKQVVYLFICLEHLQVVLDLWPQLRWEFSLLNNAVIKGVVPKFMIFFEQLLSEPAILLSDLHCC